VLSGGAGNDRLYGRDDDDSLSGGAGNDILGGDLGDDILDGGANDDWLNGRDGNDTLIVTAGVDRLNGADGEDLLLMSRGRASGSLGDDADLVRLLPGGTIRLEVDGDAGRDGIDASAVAVGDATWTLTLSVGTTAIATRDGWELSGRGDGVLRLGNTVVVTLSDMEWIAL
jgi:Ca2+-binding RTX toxin-like protein